MAIQSSLRDLVLVLIFTQHWFGQSVCKFSIDSQPNVLGYFHASLTGLLAETREFI